MIAGHTKFSPDWCFGLLKQKLRRYRVDCLDDLVDVVESSADVNFAQLVGAQSGETLVQMYDWASHFQPYFRTLHGIKKHHHFLFSKSAPHIVRIQQYSDTTETEYPLLSDTTWIPSIDKLPQIITPTGLSAERQLYLYQKIREFCREEIRDIVFPRPSSLSTPPNSPVPSQSQSPLTITVSA